MTHETIELGKGLAAIGGGATLWASDKLLAMVEGIPDIMREFGLPITVAALFGVGFVKVLHFAQKQMESRIGDRDVLLQRQDEHAKKADEFRDAMLGTQKIISDAIEKQTDVIEKNNEAILRALQKNQP